MKLPELVEYLKSEAHLQRLYQEKNFDTESEGILVYMKGELSVSSDIYFFSIEDSDDEIVIEKEGIKYYQLFPLELGVELYSYFEVEFAEKNYSEIDKAKRLLKYVVNDV